MGSYRCLSRNKKKSNTLFIFEIIIKKRIIGSIGNIKIVTPSDCVKNTELIYEDGIIKWGVCKHPYKIKESDKGKIGYLKGKPIIAHDEERVGYKVLSITEEGVLLKRCVNGLEDLVTIITGHANNEIWYTSTDGNVVTPYSAGSLYTSVLSNTYTDGKGIITFKESITSIGWAAFYDCYDNLESITIPDSVTSIGDEVFCGCSKLTSVTIPNSVTSIGNNAFYGCTALTSITFEGTVSQWNAVTTGINWDWHRNVPITTVVTCTDGTVAID